NPFPEGTALRGKVRVPAKRRQEPLNPLRMLPVADEGDKVCCGGVKEAEGERIVLTARLIGVIADRFQAEHQGDAFVSRPAPLCIQPTSHMAAVRKRRGFFW